MKPSNSLRRRIVTAYLLFALGCSLFFAMVAAVIVEGIEVRLVDERLKEVALWASPRHAGNLPVEMPAGMSFHHGESIPLSLRNLPPGVHDIDVDGVGLHVLSGRDAAAPYVVVDHESDYVEVELAVYSLLGVSLLGFIGMSLLLGAFVARRFVTPIITLSAAVAERRAELPLIDNNDELGVLARAFAEHTGEMQQFLDRERFFTGDVSHELRTPLTVISGAAEILMLETAGQPLLYRPAERIHRAASDASDSVAILLLLARSPTLIEAADVSLADVVKEEVALHQNLVGNKPVSLRYAGGADFSIRAPRKLVAAAIGNLIRNACQYTDHGTVTVALEHHCVLVADTGRGLPDALRAMLSGDQGAAAPVDLGAGSAGIGLGLALVGRICEYLGATLEIASPSAPGTAIGIRFAPAEDALTKS
ncbi:signal transduction histidine kinase [Janthinobacterium sp. CG_23.3]|uniref:sensor histidine kinase n=1 Tax=Janthinobacterium sp. CG_23.3 TaxID=3349634 RepID=UPI0038D50C48